MLPNIPPKLFSLSAIIVGYILIDDMTANEQNALGNWLMLVAQVLSTNAFYRSVMQERGLEPRESTESGKTTMHSFSTSSHHSNEEKDTIIMLQKMINALQQEIEEIKRNLSFK